MKELSPKAIVTREKILRTTDELFYQHGYNATGLDLIIKTAGVTKGNFYYYFKSKEVLAVEAIDWHFANIMEQIQTELAKEKRSPLETLFLIIGIIENDQNGQYKDGNVCGCFFGNFALELSASSTLVREKLTSIFSRYESDFSALISAAQEEGEISPSINPDDEAETILSLIEGAILLDKARQKPKSLPQAINFIKTHLNSS